MAGYIFTHFFFDNNHFARIITAIQVQSQIVASNTSNAVSLLFSSSSSLTQTSGHQQQHPATSTGNISVPFFPFHLLHLFKLDFWSSVPSSFGVFPVKQNRQRYSSFPSISNSAPLVRRDFFIGPSYSPIPNKLVSKVISSQFVELGDLLPDNLMINETETQKFLDGKLVVASARRRRIEIQNILTWVEVFTIYSLVHYAYKPLRWADLS